MGENDQLPPEPDFAGDARGHISRSCWIVSASHGSAVLRMPRQRRITLVHALILLYLALILAGKAANAQPIRYDQTATTTSAQCASGKQCPIQALPGTIVSFCTTSGFSTLAACLANPLTTYTNVGGGTPCPSTAQLTPATGGACLSTADNQGAFGIWFQPQTAYYYLRVPATAGGGTYGPYPFSFGVNGQASGVTYQLPSTGSRSITVATKLNSFYEAVADFGADSTGTLDATAASQAAISAALTAHTCPHFIGGQYKLSYSSVASLVLPSNSCLKGDGENQTIFLESTDAATVMAVTGHDVYLRDFFIGKTATATAGTGLSIYPDVTSTTQATRIIAENLTIMSAYCNEDPTNACQTTANSNRFTYGLLLQSGAKDTVYNNFNNVKIRWATNAIHMLSGGLAGSAGLGQINSNQFSNTVISDVVHCANFLAVGESHMVTTQCHSASDYNYVFDVGTGTWSASESVGNFVQSAGESTGPIKFVDFESAEGNTISAQYNETSAPSTGNFLVKGAAQNRNTVITPSVFQSGFYNLSVGNSVDTFACSGPIDFVNNPCTATVDFRSTTHNTEIMRIRNFANLSSTNLDYYRLTLGGGHIFRDNVANALTVPVATFQKELQSGAFSNVFSRYLIGTGSGSLIGDVNFAFVNTGTTGATQFIPGVVDGAGAEVYPFFMSGVRNGNGSFGANTTMPTACGGVRSGTFYNDAGTVKVCP